MRPALKKTFEHGSVGRLRKDKVREVVPRAV
jgi:hypothetical protein